MNIDPIDGTFRSCGGDLEITEQTYCCWRKEYGGVRTDQAKATPGTRERERTTEAAVSRCRTRRGDPEGCFVGKLLSPAKRHEAVDHVRQVLGPKRVSQRRACRVLGQARSTERRTPHIPDDEPMLVQRMITIATQYGCNGYRTVTGMLRQGGWKVNHKRV